MSSWFWCNYSIPEWCLFIAHCALNNLYSGFSTLKSSIDFELRLCTRVASQEPVMSASASKSADTSKTDQATNSQPERPAQQSQLGALEEDDEFEEFPAQGITNMFLSQAINKSILTNLLGLSRLGWFWNKYCTSEWQWRLCCYRQVMGG